MEITQPELFQEIPQRITIGIAITGRRCRSRAHSIANGGGCWIFLSRANYSTSLGPGKKCTGAMCTAINFAMIAVGLEGFIRLRIPAIILFWSQASQYYQPNGSSAQTTN